MKKLYIQNLGCKLNQAEAFQFSSLLEENGIASLVRSDSQSADLVLINGCAVTCQAEAKTRQAVSRISKKFPEAKIMISGCYAQHVQYFIYPGFSVGGKINFDSWARSSHTWNALAIGPAMTYYFHDRESNNWPFVGASILVRTERDDDSKESTIQLNAGMTIKMVDHFGLKAQFFYNIDRIKEGWGGDRGESGKLLGLELGFSGFLY
jgi:hypothetical protein